MKSPAARTITAALLALSHYAHAQTVTTWTGQANDFQWNTGLNWTGGLAPGASAGDIAIFDTGSTPSLNNRTVTLTGLNVLGTLTSTGTGAPAVFTLADGTLVFDNGLSVAQLQFGGNDTLTIASEITLNGNLSLNGSSPAARLNLTGAISGARNIAKSGVGLAVFSGGGKTFSGGLDIFSGSVETTLGGNSTITLGALDAPNNVLGAGNLRVGNTGTLLDFKSSGDASTNQQVSLNGSTLTAEFGGIIRLNELAAGNALQLNLNGGTLNGGTNANRGTLYLAGADLAFNDSGIGGTTVTNTPTLVFDTSTNNTAMTVTLNGGTLSGFGTVRKTGANDLNFVDSGTFGASQFVVEAGRTSFGTAALNLSTGLVFADLTPIANLLAPTGRVVFGRANQMVPGGNHLATVAGATGSLGLGGLDQSFGTITLAANSRLNLAMQPDLAAPVPTNLSIDTLSGTGLSIFGWRGNPATHIADGSATITDNVSFGTANLADVWFRGFDPGVVLGADNVLRPVDFLHTNWTSGAGASSGNIYRWFDVANWSVDVPVNRPGATVTFNTLPGTAAVVPSLEGQVVPIGHLVTNTTGRLQITGAGPTGTLVFDSGVTGMASTITGSGNVTIGAPIELRNGLTINTGAANAFAALSGTGDITVAAGGLTLTAASPTYSGDLTLSGGRLTFSNAQGLGPNTNTLHLAGGEVYAGNNSLNVKTITNPVTFDGNFTAGWIEFGYAGNVSWSGTRTITGDGTVNFGNDLRLTGTGALVVQGSASNGNYTFGSSNNDFSGGLTVLPRMGYTTGGAFASLHSNLVTGALSPGENYFGSGAISARASIAVTTNGFETFTRGPITLAGDADLTFTGGGKVTLESGTTLTRSDTSITDLVFDGDLTNAGATFAGTPNLVSNPAQGTTRRITGAIAGVGSFTKTSGGATFLVNRLDAASYTVSGGILVLNGNAVVDGTSPLTISSASVHASTGTAGSPNTNRFGILKLGTNANGSITVEDHTSLVFTDAQWLASQSLLIQNSTGIWSTAANPMASDTYVRFTSTANLTVELPTITFTGYERGATIVNQVVGTANRFIAPSGSPLTEWLGAGTNATDTNRLWSNGADWLTGVAPNGVGASAAVRGLDRKLPNNTILVDVPVTLGKLFIERGPSFFNITSQNGGSITFDHTTNAPEISVINDNSAEVSADINLLASDPLSLRHQGTKVFTLSSRIRGSGGIVSNYAGPGTPTTPEAGVIRFAGNAATSDYTGGFRLTGATGTTTSALTSREIRIATDGTLFGVGTNTGDPATSTQPFQYGDATAAWYKVIAEGGPRTIVGAVRFNGNLYHDGGITFQSADPSYITAGFKTIQGGAGTLVLDTPITGPGGLQFGGSNQAVNFLKAGTFTGGIRFLQSHSPTLGLGADDALGTGTITYDAVNTGNAPRFTSLGGPRRLSNSFAFNSPVGGAKITARFNGINGDITLDHDGRSQLNITPGLVVEAGTTTFSSTHILEGNGGLIKNGAGTLRLEAANEYLGDTEILQGTLQFGNAQAIGTTGTLVFNGTSAASYGTLASFGGARTVTNRVRFDSAVFGLDGTLGTLTLNPDASVGDVTLSLARTANVTGTAVFGANLNLTGTGSVTKSGDGTLVLTSGSSSYSGGTTINRGTLRVDSPASDITLGRAEPGQNFLGPGLISVKPLSTNPSGAGSTLELVVTDGSNVRLGGDLEISGVDDTRRAALNVTSTAGSVTGTNISTYLDATQTISGNSFGTLRTPGNLIKSGGTTTTVTGGILDTPNLVIDSGALVFAAADLASGIRNLTIGNGTLTVSQNQTFAAGSELRLAGVGAINMAGSSGFLTLGTVGSWDIAGELTISNWNGITGSGGGVEQFRFTSDVTGLFSDTMLSSVIFEGPAGTNYAPGAVVVLNTAGFFELLPVGTSGEWDDGGSGFNWSTALNWRPDIQPNGVGASAAFGDLDPTLNGKTVTVDTTNLTLGSLVFSNTQGAAFTLSGAPITFQQASATANAIISTTGNSSPNIASNLILQNDLLVSQRGTGIVTVSGAISGAGRSLIKSGPGTLVLSGANTHDGGTEFLEGVLVAATDPSLGATSGSLSFDGGTLKFGSAFDLSATRTITLDSGGGGFDTDVFTSRIGQGITGAGGLTKFGAGTLTLAGENTYAGDTTVSAGTLQIGDGGTTGSIAGDVVTHASFVFNRSDAITFGRSISGSGTMTNAGTGVTTLTGDATHTGGTIISAGTLQIGNGGTAGSIAGNILNNSALVFNRSDDITFADAVSGSGTLTQLGPGAVTLTGASSYTGGTTVSAGILRVDGSLGNTATIVHDGATLAGTGSIAGPVTVLAGGHIAPGDSPGTLTTGMLLLNPGAILDYQLNTPNVVGGPTNDLLLVNGDLTLNGTLNFSTVNPLGLLPGTYRLIGYSGALTNPAGTLDFGVIPAGYVPNVDLFIQTSVAAQVNLINAKPPVQLVFWDSDSGAVANNNAVDGGSGTWLAAPGNTAWTNIIGSVNAPWLQNGFAVFTAAPGTVTVDPASGPVTFGGAQFAVDGYTITGDSLTTDLPETFIRVGDGTDAGAAYIATINSVIAGAGGIHKVDLGTLVLGGVNTYTGGTTIGNGTVSISSDLNLGDAAGGLIFNGGTLLTTANVSSARAVTLRSGGGSIDNGGFATLLSGEISGDGGLTSTGAGTLTLTADNTYTGGTTIAAGTLQLGDGGTTGSVAGDIANNGALTFNRSDSVNFSSLINGTGSVTQAGAGTLIFSNDQTYTGGTTISAGALQLGAGGTSGSVVGNITNNSLLVFNRSDTLTFDSLVSGTGAVTQSGSGTVILTADNTYTGGTTIAAGTLQLGNGGASGSVVGDVTNDAALVFNRSDTLSFGGLITGTGSVTQAGPGTLIFANDQAYAGGTTISAGTLQLGNGGTSGSVIGNITDNAALVFNRSDTFVLGNQVSGTGSVTQAGTGTLIFANDQTYTGGTTISAGALQLGDGGASGSVVGDIANDSALVFNRSDTFSFGGVVSGTGSVTQAGSGTLVFASDHTYTGGTTISAGTLQLGDGGASGSVVGDVTNNAALVFNRADTFAFDSLISGSGSVTQAGAGTTILTADNSYTGGTTISAGTLRLGDGGASGSVIGDVTDNAALVFNRSDIFAFGGIVSGSGSVTQAGTGTLVFTTDHSYTGGTTISTGTLQLGAGGTSGSVIGDITDNAALVINRSDTLNYAGLINGTGTVTQAGTGTLIFARDQAYTGGTAITSGTLQLGDGGTGGSVAGNIANDSALVFNRSDAFTFGGNVSGSGSVTQAGSGTLIFTSDHSYTGGTAISAGTLQLGNGGASGSVIGDITNNGLLVFNRSDNLDFSAVIEGTGGVVKLATNTLTLSGISTYTGPTQVDAGRLMVHGQIASPVTVAPGAMLGGNGTVGSVLNAGIVSPGASLGTLTVAGNFTQQPSGALHIELDDRGGFDVLDVAGTASLAGRVDYLPDTLSTFSEDLLYTYLPTGGGVSGQFVNSIQQYAGVTFETIYNPDNVQVRINSEPIDVTPGGEDLISCIASLEAQRAAVRGTSLAPLLNSLIFMPLGAVPGTIHGICPRDPSALPTALDAQVSARFGMLSNRIAQVHGAGPAAANGLFDSYRLREGVDLWVRGTYQEGDQSGRDILRTGADSDNREFAMGVDVALENVGALGAYLAHDNLHLGYRAPANAPGHSGQVKDRGWNLGFYGSYWSEARWFAQGMVEYGWHDLESERHASIAGNPLAAEGERNGRSFAANTGFGFNFEPVTRLLIQPQLTVGYQRFADDAYSESGPQALALSYSGLNADTLRGEAGVTVRKTVLDAKFTDEIMVAYLYANYVYDEPLDNRNLTAKFAIGDPFEMIGDEKTREGIRYGLGVENTWRDNATMQLLFDVQDYSGIQTLGASLRFSRQF